MHEAYTAALWTRPARCATSSVSCIPKFSLMDVSQRTLSPCPLRFGLPVMQVMQVQIVVQVTSQPL